jgi:hypothetical protein
VLITNEFHEFCWSTITGTSNERKVPYGLKSIHILIMSKTRGVHRQYDTKGQCGTRPGSGQPKVGPVGPTPLAGLPGPGIFPKTIFTRCQNKLLRGVSNVEKVMEWLNVATRPSFMAGQPDNWASRTQSFAGAPPYSSYKYPGAPLGRKCEESEV